MKTRITDEAVDTALHRLVNTAKEAADLRAERWLQEEMRKSTKAMCMRDAESNGHNSGIMQEREAYASDRYRAQLEKIREAVFRDEQMRMERAGWEKVIDVYRTQQANDRQTKL